MTYFWGIPSFQENEFPTFSLLSLGTQKFGLKRLIADVKFL